MPTVNEIHEHFLSNAPWLDRENTVDTIKAGDPSRDIKTVAVGWMSTIYDLREAVRLGCELFITHEPTFWEHAAPEQKNRNTPEGAAKVKLLEESGLVVLRCHDVWDAWPEIGIRDGWAAGLGLTEVTALSDDKWTAVYQIRETTLRDFAEHVLSKVKPIGQDSVQVMGDPDMRISRPCLGVGCYTPKIELIKRGADCFIGTFDGDWDYWQTRERLVECGVGVISVEHGTTENWGMRNCADYVRKTWPELDVQYLQLYPKPWTVM